MFSSEDGRKSYFIYKTEEIVWSYLNGFEKKVEKTTVKACSCPAIIQSLYNIGEMGIYRWPVIMIDNETLFLSKTSIKNNFR